MTASEFKGLGGFEAVGELFAQATAAPLAVASPVLESRSIAAEELSLPKVLILLTLLWSLPWFAVFVTSVCSGVQFESV